MKQDKKTINGSARYLFYVILAGIVFGVGVLLAFFVGKNIGYDMGNKAVSSDQPAPEPSENPLNLHMARMKAPMDALSQLMYDTSAIYDKENATYVWSAIYYMINMYPNDEKNVEKGLMKLHPDEMTVSVHKDLLLSYAQAMFDSLEELPELEDFTSQEEDNNRPLIQEDSEDPDYYIITISERGPYRGEMRTWCENEDNTAIAQFLVADATDNSVLAYYMYEMTPASDQESIFPYRVSGQSMARNTYEATGEITPEIDTSVMIDIPDDIDLE
ncbi:MAG: hypothetical protein K2O59_01635 [Lachnospiraceae bacterium]|nr:hypothetical protein [Lachnospiraceae bacterium]MDE7176492.1 hypothetical protein [Lachnospiraceae bacterium]